MQIQIKLAETGHSETATLPEEALGEDLFNSIAESFKISQKDQAIVTKTGNRVKPDSKLDKMLTNQKHDKTIVGRDINKFDQQRIACVYLFNVKDINKQLEQPDSKEKKVWLDKLSDELEKFKKLRSNITPFEQLSSMFSPENLKAYPKAVELITSVRNSFMNLEKEYRELKQIHTKIEDLSERCQNQRKSMDSLCYNVNQYVADLKRQASELLTQKQILKKNLTIDDKSLRQNSGYFEMKKKQQNVSVVHQQRTNQLIKKSNSLMEESKKTTKTVKSKYQPVSQKIIQYANFKVMETIEIKSSGNINKYKEIINHFRLLTQTQDFRYMTNLQTTFNDLEKTYLQKQTQEFQTLLGTLTDFYCDFCEMNQKNRFIGRDNYRTLIKCKEQLIYFIKEVHEEIRIISDLTESENKLDKEISSFSQKNFSQIEEPSSFFSKESQNSLESFKLSIKSEAEVKRRIKFYKKLNYLQSFGDKVCAEEEALRKRYQRDNKNAFVKKQYLSNIKVPTVDIDFNGTTDLQLFKANNVPEMANKEEPISAEEFMVLEYQTILEKINRMAGISQNQKMKSMQQILKSVSDIFYKIYHRKHQQFEQKNKELIEANSSLQEKCKSLSQELIEKTKSIEKVQESLKQKENELTVLETKKNEELRKEKSRYDKCNGDKKSLESQLKQQMKINEELINQFSLADQEVEELKTLLAQKEIQIIRLEQENMVKSTTKDFVSSDPQEPSQDNTDLKQLVVQNLAQKVEKENEKQSEVVHELQNENNLLQKQNELLQEEVQSLSLQLRKMIVETVDVETQADSLSESVHLKSQHFENFSIGEDITVNQSAIFMPFNNRLYVGVCCRDQDRTLCHVSNTYHQNYILDIDSFNSKTKELLSECSFLVVLKVQKIKKDSSNFLVEGRIQYLLGFEDDNLAIKNYASFLMV